MVRVLTDGFGGAGVLIMVVIVLLGRLRRAVGHTERNLPSAVVFSCQLVGLIARDPRPSVGGRVLKSKIFGGIAGAEAALDCEAVFVIGKCCEGRDQIITFID